MNSDYYDSDYVNRVLFVYLNYCSWDTNLNKLVDFYLDPFFIDLIHAMFCFYVSLLGFIQIKYCLNQIARFFLF